ncbi:MAG: sodium:solute symporter family protein, partial [Methanomassiliicoccaceae archaeon]|nr:sodium:solute symporter family protein [Methanomassiliicoccaceae archaeon]
RYGMMMIWLVFLNLFAGLMIAFIVFGKRTRRLNVKLGALTFADFLGKRFKSPFIRVLTAIIVLVGMPIYCAAVLLGGVNFLVATDIGITKDMAILLISVVVLVYVAYGGIIAVMYNDALQAGIMFIGMAVILVVTYFVLSKDYGSFSGIHEALTDLWQNRGGAYDPAAIPDNVQGVRGWNIFPEFASNAWIYGVSTLLMGVGIGALAQPQLAARFMTAKDSKTLNRSMIVGAVFILMIVGTAYTVGALTNLYFADNGFSNAMDAVGWNVDKVIPEFVNKIFGGMGAWGEMFVIIFILGLLCAAISTIGALLHTMGASAGHDLWSEAERKFKRIEVKKPSLTITRIATVAMMVVVILLAYLMPPSIIAKATSVFMGLTAAALLPAYTYAVYAKAEPNTSAAKLSMVVGSIVWLVWALFVNVSIGGMIGTPIIASGQLVYVDPLIVALPISAAIMIIGALKGRPKRPWDESLRRYETVWTVRSEKQFRGLKDRENRWPEHRMRAADAPSEGTAADHGSNGRMS